MTTPTNNLSDAKIAEIQCFFPTDIAKLIETYSQVSFCRRSTPGDASGLLSTSDGRYLFYWSEVYSDPSIYQVCLETEETRRIPTADLKLTPHSAVVSPDNQFLLIYDRQQGQVWKWTIATGVWSYFLYAGSLDTLCISNDGQFFFGCVHIMAGPVKQWSMLTQALVDEITLPPGVSQIGTALGSPRLLAVSEFNGVITVHQWCYATRTWLTSPESIQATDPSQRGDFFFRMTSLIHYRLFTNQFQTYQHSPPDPIIEICNTPNCQFLFTTGLHGNVYQWQIGDELTLVQSFDAQDAYTWEITCPDNQSFCYLTDNGIKRVLFQSFHDTAVPCESN